MSCSRVLVVEDEELIRLILAEVLEDEGFHVVEASTGDQAVVLMDGDDKFHAVVTDIHMPGSLDGLGVARLVRALRPDLPVIYTTGRPDVLNHLQPLGPGEALLQKPFDLSDLVAAARRLLGPFH